MPRRLQKPVTLKLPTSKFPSAASSAPLGSPTCPARLSAVDNAVPEAVLPAPYPAHASAPSEPCTRSPLSLTGRHSSALAHLELTPPVSLRLQSFFTNDAATIMTAYAMRPKGPQPVLDSLTEPDPSDLSDAAPERHRRPNTAPRLSVPLPPGHPINQSVTKPFSDTTSASRDDTNGFVDPRPTLQRAKSDFGPRREEQGRNGDEDSKASTDGEWGIRHGFATQLVSEEYNNLLTSVRTYRLRTAVLL
jgi:hypothetical protein